LNKIRKPQAAAAGRQRAPLSNERIAHMVALFGAGQWDALETAARDATVQHPEHLFGWKALGKVLIVGNRMLEARAPLERAARISPQDADVQSDMGQVLHALGQPREAQLAFERALKLNPRCAGAWCNLGMVQRDLGLYAEAEASYRRELETDPVSAVTHNNLCALLLDTGRLDEGLVAVRAALALAPQFAEAHVNLGHVLTELGDAVEAEAALRTAIALNPALATAHSRLGGLVGRDKARANEAAGHLQQALALQPGDADAMLAIGNLLLDAKRDDEAAVFFARAQEIKPLITWKALQAKADFSVLLLDAPGAGCTPLNYLAGRANYDRHFLALLPGVEPDVEFLRGKADIVVNMIADADNGAHVLPRALALVDALGLPTLNHPRLILASDRESVALKLEGIAGCRSPRTVRAKGHLLAGEQRGALLAGFAAPVLVRRAGTHGGDDFDKVETLDAVGAFVQIALDEDFYVSEFIDCQSPDGGYRKYRFICINGEILPYHLAIHDHWMVHHFRTDMAEQAWKRAEEESFLRETGRYFNDAHLATLAKIRDAMGLDYGGIDLSLDQQGNIVVFEANATMLVHDEKAADFRYKNPYIATIKAAFDAALGKLAGRA
jgi:tetratricopeptide (TPR) repeat protein